MGLLAARKEQEQKEKDEYIEKKIRQLDARRERQRQRSEKKADRMQQAEQQREIEEKARMDAFRNAPLKVGEKVRVKSNGMVGEVIRVSEKAVQVTIGNIVSKLPSDKLERISSNEFKTAVKAETRNVSKLKIDSSVSERKLNFKTELDVRGERVSDALDQVTRFIDDALMLAVPSVRIIHGKGTGALREEIQRYLRTVPGVLSVSDEHIQFGGTGVTIVNFD